MLAEWLADLQSCPEAGLVSRLGRRFRRVGRSDRTDSIAGMLVALLTVLCAGAALASVVASLAL